MTKAKDKQAKRQADKATHKTRREIDSASERSDPTLDESEAAPAPNKKRREDFSQAAVRIGRKATKD
jgi:hypothetical protein